jgi:nucleoside-diphosphate-sugar epimerase
MAPKKYLVTGATGSLGAALVRQLAGKDLHVLVRSEEAFEERFEDVDATVVEGDLSEQDTIDIAIDDVDTVFHCACVPYFHWGDMIGHTRRLIKAAEEEEKVVDIVFPGNVLVYGDVGPGVIRENQVHTPRTKKGMIRVNMERCLREANTREECRTTVARFPDLYGPDVHSRCQRRIFPSVLKGANVKWPGDLEADREFIYVDDAATAMLRLANSEVAWGQAWHVPGPGTITAQAFIETAFEEAKNEPLIKTGITASMGMGDMFTKDAKEEKELLYLFLRPPILDGGKWLKHFGPHPATPYEEGIRSTVEWWRDHPEGH